MIKVKTITAKKVKADVTNIESGTVAFDPGYLTNNCM